MLVLELGGEGGNSQMMSKERRRKSDKHRFNCCSLILLEATTYTVYELPSFIDSHLLEARFAPENAQLVKYDRRQMPVDRRQLVDFCLTSDQQSPADCDHDTNRDRLSQLAVIYSLVECNSLVETRSLNATRLLNATQNGYKVCR